MDLTKILNVEEIKFLKDMAMELKTQDPSGTEPPIFFQVLTDNIVGGQDRDFVADECIIIGDECDVYYSVEELKQAMLDIYRLREIDVADIADFDDAEELMDEFGWNYTRTGWHVVEEVKNAFLTRKACEAHIKTSDPREYVNPRVYVSRGRNNPELEQLLTIIGKFAGIELPEGDGK